ncbi:MAG: phosphoribosylformylglycinamidine synthase subunit PurS [Nitrospirota bacterium]|nr:phosphoribosylformylglycinamidine synthase subunit PurS [Nitrospirota bacterium]
MKATVTVTFKNGVLEPQGKAVLHSLHTLGFGGVNNVRVGKLIELDLEDGDQGKAHEQVTRMCEELLASPVIENYHIDIQPG